MSKKSIVAGLSVAFLAVAGLAAGNSHTLAAADSQSSTAATVTRVLAYENDCAPSAAWKRAGKAERKKAERAMTIAYGEKGNAWSVQDLHHSYQGTRGHLTRAIKGLPVHFVAVKGNDPAFGPSVGWCYRDSDFMPTSKWEKNLKTQGFVKTRAIKGHGECFVLVDDTSVIVCRDGFVEVS